MIQTILVILVGIIVVSVLAWMAREIVSPERHVLQREVNLRLTYKRYIEIYPSANVTYQQYKKMQSERAYKKAVSSTKIKRMVR